MNYKRIISAVLAITLAAGTVALPTAESGFSFENVISASAETLNYGDYKYTVLDDGTVEITKYSGIDMEVTVPSEIDGKKVTSIGDGAFGSCTNLISVTIPNSVISIGDWAFGGCTNLISIKIPDSVTSIGYEAFMSCANLKSITIPNSVTSIGYGVFWYCTSLTSITLPNGITSIDYYAFTDCESLTDITIPNSVTSIDTWAFCGCISLTSITIPNSVTSIGYWAFYYCTSLTDVYYTGTKAQWNSIAIYEENDYLTNATIHYNYDPNHTHTYTKKVVKPTYTAKGYTLYTCSNCDDSYKDNYTAKLTKKNISKATVSTSKSKYAYTGKALKPAVTVKYGSSTLKKGTDYTVSYKNNTKTGKATVTVTGKGKYTGTITKTFNIVPTKATLSSVKSSKTKTVTVKWKKDMQATGYQVVYATNSKFKSAKSVTVKKNTTTSTKISKLTKGKTYYVKVRSYKTIDGKKVYGAYSAAKKVTCK